MAAQTLSSGRTLAMHTIPAAGRSMSIPEQKYVPNALRDCLAHPRLVRLQRAVHVQDRRGKLRLLHQERKQSVQNGVRRLTQSSLMMSRSSTPFLLLCALPVSRSLRMCIMVGIELRHLDDEVDRQLQCWSRL